LALALASACSTTKIKSGGDPQWDYSKWKTYGWLPAKGDVGEGSPFWPDLKRMVDKALKEKGLMPAAEGVPPDFMVSFFTGIGMSSNVTWGYMYPSWMTLNPRYLNDDDFAKGVIVLDFVDPKTNQLVWRGGASQEFSERVTNKPDEMALLIKGLLPRILSGYPPAGSAQP